MSLTPYARNKDSIVALGDSKPDGTGSPLQDSSHDAPTAMMRAVRTAWLSRRIEPLSNY